MFKKNALLTVTVKRGISVIVGVVLLVALSVITAVGLYYWSGAFTGPRDQPVKPHTIAIRPIDTEEGRFFVSNLGTEDFIVSSLATSEEGVTCDFNGSTTINSGSGAVCYMSPKVGTVSIFGSDSNGKAITPTSLTLGVNDVADFAFFALASAGGGGSATTLTYAANDADGLEWVALTEDSVVVENNTVSGCETFYSATYSSYNASKTYVGQYKDCDGNTVSQTYS
jgi:hypothetical protein